MRSIALAAAAALMIVSPSAHARTACELGKPCHHCPAGKWYCAGHCIPKDQACRPF